MILLIAAIASAGTLEWLFGQETGITGAPTAQIKTVPQIKNLELSLRGTINSDLIIEYGKRTELPNGVVAVSTYNNGKVTLVLTKTIEAANNDIIKMDDGNWNAKVNNEKVIFVRGMGQPLKGQK